MRWRLSTKFPALFAGECRESDAIIYQKRESILLESAIFHLEIKKLAEFSNPANFTALLVFHVGLFSVAVVIICPSSRAGIGGSANRT